MNIIWRVSAYLFRYKFLFGLTLGLALGSMLFLLMVPRIIQWVFDDIIQSGRYEYLWYGVLLVAFCYFGRELLNCLRIRVNNTVEQKVLLDLRSDLHAKLLDLPVSFYDRRKSGEIASRVIEDVQNLERGLLDGTEQGSVAILTIVGITSMLFWMEPKLAVLVMAPVPVLIFLAWQHAKATRRNWKKVRESAGELNSLLIEDIQGNRLIHSFALRGREHERFMAQAKDLRVHSLRAMFRWSIYSPLSSYLSSLGTVAVVGMGGYMLMQDSGFSFGQFLAFFAYCSMLYEPVSRLNSLNHMLSEAKASGERVFEILDQPLIIQDPKHPKPFPEGLLEICYQSVFFSYPDREEIIENLNLILPAGKVTALVGHTGAGKSTVANLLLRYYDVNDGSVKINDVDVRSINLTELRSNIGFVAQDPFLFDGTVKDNLRLARENATDDEIISALKGARSWEFVSRLPHGLNTAIGERGIRLSMGEKQRLTIARVLLKNPPLIILDEATSSVDSITEKAIQEALDLLIENRTVLVIAHRLSTVRRADHIVVMDHGSIIEQGTHTKLLEQDGQYAQLWRAQQDLIPETV
jgi:ABC-type multidrug transport system fused ATPase/permease subunit